MNNEPIFSNLSGKGTGIQVTVSEGLSLFWKNLNGTYCPSGTYGGKTRYVNSATGAEIYWETSYWVLEYDGETGYTNSSSSDPPSFSNWTAEDAPGNQPPPTLTSANC